MSHHPFRLILDIDIVDEDALIAYARERYEKCYGGALEDIVLDDDTLLDRAILEAMLWSSEGPPYLDVGLEVTDARFA